MQPVEDAGALPGQVVATLGQQPQDGGLVLGGHHAQRRAVQGGLGHAGGIGGVGHWSTLAWTKAA
jgi:hypothetical protein